MDPASTVVLALLLSLFAGLVYLRLQDPEYHGDLLDKLLSRFTDRRAPPTHISEAASAVEVTDTGGEEISVSGAVDSSDGTPGETGGEGGTDASPPDDDSEPSAVQNGQPEDGFGPVGTSSPPGGNPLPEDESVGSVVEEDGDETGRAFFDPDASGGVVEGEPGDDEFWGGAESEVDVGGGESDGETDDSEPPSRDGLDPAGRDPDDTIIGYELAIEPSDVSESAGEIGDERSPAGREESTPEEHSESGTEGDSRRPGESDDPAYGVVEPPRSDEEQPGDESSEDSGDRDNSPILGFDGPHAGPDGDDD